MNKGKNFLVEFKTSGDDFNYIISYDKCDDDCKKAIDFAMKNDHREFYDETGEGEWEDAIIDLPATIHSCIMVIESY
jgi:hypothetical protein